MSICHLLLNGVTKQTVSRESDAFGDRHRECRDIGIDKETGALIRIMIARNSEYGRIGEKLFGPLLNG